MRITFNNYTPYYKKTTNPTFQSNGRTYKMPNGIDMLTVTCPFRNDIDWSKFAKFEIENFKNKNEVNIIQFGASDGSEAYTQIMSLLENGDRLATKKFFPILAFDIDETIVNVARSKLLNLNQVDECEIADNCKSFHKYFSKSNNRLQIPNNLYENFKCFNSIYTTYKVAPILTNKVCFNKGDIFQLAPHLKDDSNTVILCRNMLAYFPQHKIEQIVDTFSQNLKTGSLIATGKLEERLVNYYLRAYDFEEVMKNVFRKI